jgi:3-hydroxy-9,10-secoandrosta-1,3,5(10)-triene-9,17-dione monooxygenase reductase component
MADDLTARRPPADALLPTPAEWRAAMGYFPSGVTIVTSWQERSPVGTTVNAICSVSLEPPLLLVCLDHANPALRPIQASGLLGVNILGCEHRDLALTFGRESGEDRFDGVGYRAADGGAPQLDAAPVFIDCLLEQAHVAGDHTIVVARPVRIEHASAVPPLLYHRGAFPKLA